MQLWPPAAWPPDNTQPTRSGRRGASPEAGEASDTRETIGWPKSDGKRALITSWSATQVVGAPSTFCTRPRSSGGTMSLHWRRTVSRRDPWCGPMLATDSTVARRRFLLETWSLPAT